MFGIGLIGFSVSRQLLALAVLILLAWSFGMMQQMAASNTILQTIVDDDKRGRVMSFYSMAFMGMAPFGSLLAGTAATRIGAPTPCSRVEFSAWGAQPGLRLICRSSARQCGLFTGGWGFFLRSRRQSRR